MRALMAGDLILKQRYLEHLLADDPGSIGLTLDLGGWALVDDVVSRGFGRLTHSEIAQIVTLSEGRLEQSRDAARVRATGGHAFPVDLTLVPGYPPDVLYVAVAADALDAALTQGLTRSGRNCPRLWPDPEAARAAVAEGARVLSVDVAQMLGRGAAFLSRDGREWLVEAVPAATLRVPG